MKQIDCASVITEYRRKKGITQEALASHLGVVKATVSKWETGASYPDILQLPLLATFFDISIDTLINYSPQMMEEDIAKLYQRLALDFTQKPFETVITEIEGITKKYYSCYDLLYRLVLLYVNHAAMAGDEERTRQIIKKAIPLCQRITANSDDQSLIWATINIQALCHLTVKEATEVLELMGETLTDTAPDRTLIAQAYRLLGKEEKAHEAFQADLIQKLMEMFHSMMAALQNNLDDLARAEPIFLKAEAMANLFNMKCLNVNNTAILYILGAMMYQTGHQSEQALALLKKYVDVCIHDFFPFQIRGDAFFDKLDNFLTENTTQIPRSETAIINDMLQYLHNPLFAPLHDNADYKHIVNKLTQFVHTRQVE